MIHYLPRSSRESLRSLDSAATMGLPMPVFILFAAYLLNADDLLVISLVNGLDSPGVWRTLWQRIHRFGDHRLYAVPLPAANWPPPRSVLDTAHFQPCDLCFQDMSTMGLFVIDNIIIHFLHPKYFNWSDIIYR